VKALIVQNESVDDEKSATIIMRHPIAGDAISGTGSIAPTRKSSRRYG
jgi:hypothetical protein